ERHSTREGRLKKIELGVRTGLRGVRRRHGRPTLQTVLSGVGQFGAASLTLSHALPLKASVQRLHEQTAQPIRRLPVRLRPATYRYPLRIVQTGILRSTEGWQLSIDVRSERMEGEGHRKNRNRSTRTVCKQPTGCRIIPKIEPDSDGISEKRMHRPRGPG